MTIHIDFETRSTVDLKKTGAYVYAEDPTTDVWCCAYALDNAPVKLWVPSDPCPKDIFLAASLGEDFLAHNAAFERVIWHYVMAPRYGWPEPDVEQWRCTMAMALAMSLPGSLENAALAVNLDVGKDMGGHRLMMQMARPRSREPLTWWDTPEKLERLYAYCKNDVEVERQLEKRLLPLRPFEQSLWHLDQRINDRGVYVDVPLCNAAIKIVDQAKERLDAEMSAVTGREVTACTNRNQLVTWLKAQGFDVESIAKDQVEEILARADLAPHIRRALELRREGSKTSNAKVETLLAGRNKDGRVRGLFQYHMTPTARWGGRRFQPHNLPRGNIKDKTTLMSAIATGSLDVMTMLYEHPMEALSSGLRGLIIAAPGHKLVAADFSNIEGRVAAWYAGEDWKVEAFKAFDSGKGPDLYKLAYGRAFGVPHETIDDHRRQIGKVMELSAQYQGGHGAFVGMAANYGLRPADITPVVKAAVDTDTWTTAEEKYRPINSFGMALDDWTALRIVIDGWRRQHPNIKGSWKDLDAASMSAVCSSGNVYTVGRVKFRRTGSFLWMQVPSGGAVCYPYPVIKKKLMPWVDDNEEPVYRDAVRFKTVFQGAWMEEFTYGGMIFNYVVQRTARDLLAEAMVRLEAARYPVVMHVHDEAISEVPEDFGSSAEFNAIMAEVPAWAEGCPIAAGGWEGRRYRKG